jgi:DNA-damage-inducible protein J
MLTRVAARKPCRSSRWCQTPTTIEAMKEARRGGLKSFDTVEDLMSDLNADD